MNALQMWRLKLYCENHKIDTMEIDDEINYKENMVHLKSMTTNFNEVDARMLEWEGKMNQYFHENILELVIISYMIGDGPKFEPPPPEKPTTFSLLEYSKRNRENAVLTKGILQVQEHRPTTTRK